jgi:glycosyltransferase involved in cell wall biosynthesis
MPSRRILYIQFTDPAGYPPLAHSSVLLANRGWDVLFLGVGGNKENSLKLASVSRLRVKLIRYFEGGWRQKLQYIFFFCWTLWCTWRWKPQWIYASEPLSCPVAWWNRRLTGVHVLYHEHDSPSPDAAATWFMKQVLAYRERLARDAELCVLPQQNRLLSFLESTGRTKPAYCVWNCPGLEDLTKLSPERGHSDPFILYYHGSITPDRLPTQLVVAATRFRGAVRVQVAGYETLGSTGYMRKLAAVAAANGAAGIIEPLGTIPYRTDLLRSASKAHVGIALMPKQSKDMNLQSMLGASNKPFDYMACGLALLVTDLPDWVEAFVKCGYGKACDPGDADSIEVALQWYLDHPAQRREMGVKGRDQVREAWNYETMFACVLPKLESC